MISTQGRAPLFSKLPPTRQILMGMIIMALMPVILGGLSLNLLRHTQMVAMEEYRESVKQIGVELDAVRADVLDKSVEEFQARFREQAKQQRVMLLTVIILTVAIGLGMGFFLARTISVRLGQPGPDGSGRSPEQIARLLEDLARELRG